MSRNSAKSIAEKHKGKPCPKCSERMFRCVHGRGWKPKPTQPYYFAYWDWCKKCRHTQMYDVAKRYVGKPPIIETCVMPEAVLDQVGPPPWEETNPEPPWIIPLPLMEW